MPEFANTYQVKTHTQLKSEGRYKCLSPVPKAGTGVSLNQVQGCTQNQDSTCTQNPTLVSDVESTKESSERVSKPNPARSLKSESKPAGKKKRLENFPRVMETREEREEFRACLGQMRDAMNTTPVRKMDELEDGGDISELESFPEQSPETVPNFDPDKFVDLSTVPALNAACTEN